MAMPEFTLRQLLEAGVHFGHHTRRWNPRMAPYLFGVRNQVHIIDLQQTVPMLERALRAVRDVTAAEVACCSSAPSAPLPRQAAELAKRCGQYYVNHRWLGGALTNWKTIAGSHQAACARSSAMAQRREYVWSDQEGNPRHHPRPEKLELRVGRHQGNGRGTLDASCSSSSTNKERLAVEEATKLNIPVVAIWDSNSEHRPA